MFITCFAIKKQWIYTSSIWNEKNTNKRCTTCEFIVFISKQCYYTYFQLLSSQSTAFLSLGTLCMIMKTLFSLFSTIIVHYFHVPDGILDDKYHVYWIELQWHWWIRVFQSKHDFFTVMSQFCRNRNDSWFITDDVYRSLAQ